jgi:multiple sugar transport system permease protein
MQTQPQLRNITISSKKGKKYKLKESLAFYACISPWVIGFLILTIGPMIVSFYLSLTKWDMLTPAKFVGLANYQKMFTDDPLFWQSLKVTSLYTLFHVPLGLAVALGVAMLMNQNVKGINWYRTIYYLPMVISGVAVSVLWMWVFNPQFGLLNEFLSWFGITGPGWITDPDWALTAIVIMSLWGFGGPAIIFLAGLKNIPTYLYEAADIDGASKWQKFWKITIPQLTPTIFFNFIMSVIGSFQTFTQAYVMTNGGPEYSTLFYYYYLYDQAFGSFKMGYASALAWFLFLIIFICSLLIFKSSSFWVYYEGGKGDA